MAAICATVMEVRRVSGFSDWGHLLCGGAAEAHFTLVFFNQPTGE